MRAYRKRPISFFFVISTFLIVFIFREGKSRSDQARLRRMQQHGEGMGLAPYLIFLGSVSISRNSLSEFSREERA